MGSLPECHIHRHLKGRAQHSPDGMNGTAAFPILLLQFDKKQLCIGSFHTSYRLFAKCFLCKQSLYCNISLFRALPYSCLCFQISVYQFTDCHLSVHDIYKQIPICVYLFFQFTKGEAWLLALWKFVRRLQFPTIDKMCFSINMIFILIFSVCPYAFSRS